jgi:hypothetical protein
MVIMQKKSDIDITESEIRLQRAKKDLLVFFFQTKN